MACIITFDQIQELKPRLHNNTLCFCPGDKGYIDSLQRWSDLASQPAGIVIYPDDADDVSTIVQFASSNNLDLAVNCGGHSSKPTASTRGGILIDPGRMSKVSVDPKAETVTTEGGASWGEVYAAIDPFKLAIVGAVTSRVGVGGLAVQGGYGYLSPQHGLVIDNLISAKVVIADGRQLVASKDENPDLFWAVRGAGGCIGVVVEFTFRAHPQPRDVWAGTLTFSVDKSGDVLHALSASLPRPEERAAALCQFSMRPGMREAVVTTALFFNGSEDEGRQHFSHLFQLKPIEYEMRMRSFLESNKMLDSIVPQGGRKQLLSVHLAPTVRRGFASEVIEKLKSGICNEPNMLRSYLEIDFLSMAKICQVPVQDTAFPYRRAILNGDIVLQWTDPSKDDKIMKTGREIETLFHDELEDSGYDPGMLVSNYCSYTSENDIKPTEMYGGNAHRLLEIKKRYDPQNLFHKLNPLKPRRRPPKQ